jgi:5-formyltetrahydrofolate cyclo-ligase
VVAVVFDGELVEDLPAEAHGLQVTAVVTSSGGWQALPTGH